MSTVRELMATGTQTLLAQALVGSVTRSATATGTTQTDALPFSTGVIYVTTTASGTGVRLNGTSDFPATIGDEQTVYNYGANALKVYPPVGEAITPNAVNVPISLAPSSSCLFKKVANAVWVTNGDGFVELLTPEQFGAVGDGKRITGATISMVTPKKLTDTSNPFVAGDVGKRIIVWGAAASTDSLADTIAAVVSAGEITLTNGASTAVSGVEAHYGTDNYTAFQNAVTALLALGGGCLRCAASYFICHGADGTIASQQFLTFAQCSDIHFDFSGGTFLGCLIGNTLGGGASTVKNYRVRITGGTFRAVGDRVDAINSSSNWNNLGFNYAEDVQVRGVTIYVPAGARAISFQTASTIGTDATKLKNIIFDDYLIIGPTVAADQYKSDGIDFSTDGLADNLTDGVTIGDGIVLNTGRGIYTQSGGTNFNHNFSIGNLQIINPRTIGAQILGVRGLRVNSLSVYSQGKSASASANNGTGVYLSNNDRVEWGRMSITGEDVAGLGTAFSLADTASTLHQRFGRIEIDTLNSSNKWTAGFTPAGHDAEIGSLTIGNCTTGFNNSNKRILIRALTFMNNTSNYAATLTLPAEHVLDARSIDLASAGAPTLLHTMPGFSASLSAPVANFSGNGALYLAICNTETYDNVGNYDNTTGVFTAPIAGRYHFDARAYIDSITAAMTSADCYVRVNAGSFTLLFHCNAYATADAGQTLLIGGGADINMAASDTAQMIVRISNGVGNTARLLDTFTQFSGHLIRS